MKTAIIDNYDSFTYNLVHIVRDIVGHDIDVYRNDQVDLDQLETYDKIILSPGPGLPDEAGQLKDVIRTYGPRKHLFGVCLGLQAMGEVYGGQLANLHDVYHGKQTTMYKTDSTSPIFAGLGETFLAGRYHSWVVDKYHLPIDMTITCRDADGQIMGADHTSYHVYGVQFHPESIMTPEGSLMIQNFLDIPIT